MIQKNRSYALFIFFVPIVIVNILLIVSQSLVLKTNDVDKSSPYYHEIPGNYFYNLRIYELGDSLRSRQHIDEKGLAIPYIDGSTSISRLGRVKPNQFIFKPFMILTGIILCLFWSNQKKIFNKIIKHKDTDKIFFLGFATGISLIIHIFFLGINFDNNYYKFFVRFILAVSVISGILSKIYFVKLINKLNKNYNFFNNIFFKIQKYVVYLIIFLIIIFFPLQLIYNTKTLVLIFEWNIFVLIFSFYIFYYFSWKNYSLIQPPPRTLSPN